MKKALLIALASLAFTVTAQAAKHKSPFNCARKTCSKISSCAEAEYKLQHCGHKKLDRDRDGIPCEKLCR